MLAIQNIVANNSWIAFQNIILTATYENFYTLSYIDKMWGILRREAFPEEIQF